jgi:hypothetical protein
VNRLLPKRWHDRDNSPDGQPRVQGTRTFRRLLSAGLAVIHSTGRPFGAGPSIRDRNGERHLLAEGKFVHVGGPDQVAMAAEAARRAMPEAPLSFVVTAARRTPAGGPSFLPGEARYACQRGFVPQIG